MTCAPVLAGPDFPVERGVSFRSEGAASGGHAARPQEEGQVTTSPWEFFAWSPGASRLFISVAGQYLVKNCNTPGKRLGYLIRT